MNQVIRKKYIFNVDNIKMQQQINDDKEQKAKMQQQINDVNEQKAEIHS